MPPSQKSVSELRPCISVTVLGFRVILRKCTAYRENKKPNSSVHFRQSVESPSFSVRSQKFRYNFWDF